ncbi:hypothetical protein BO82DRAFT_138891 [Aspergillus uvarum CBS 121591]|uniref:Uncharacterized protein n=1 Tax=Aspergillus uvarum CBS 121591 TaxID=1448315 RepID=A0A319C598_9EURO|nr:hypothetical protein BO82DRAFT_138891 [Aspergillus uvarum CBS 121591]PYH79137.1 hypothetical protein BO82DRAFT_138891 [Aspergillus uvarum CBS 121591]
MSSFATWPVFLSSSLLGYQGHLCHFPILFCPVWHGLWIFEHTSSFIHYSLVMSLLCLWSLACAYDDVFHVPCLRSALDLSASQLRMNKTFSIGGEPHIQSSVNLI